MEFNMKKAFFVMLAAFVFVACYVPSPLYGTWADNNGNKITFISDGTFASQIKDGAGMRRSFSGSYSTVDNVLTFSYQWEGVSYSMNTEWDIRGSLLYCTWTFDGNQTIKLTLYHTAR